MRIVTDSGADITAAEAQALGVSLAPLLIQFPQGEVNPALISADEFYDRLEAMHPAIPTTTQPSQGIFAEIYRSLGQTDPQVLSVHISSGLSGTMNSARLGAEDVSPLPQVALWDTLTLAGGQRLQVLAAVAAAKAGWPLEKIQQRLADIRAKAEVVFTLETLEYLVNGGRIGRVQGVAGMLLNIKPIIHVDHKDGKYTNVAKSRSVPRALTAIVDYLHTIYGNTPLWVLAQHGRLPESAEALASQLCERLNVAHIETVRISPVLGVHTGPGIVGASVVPFALLADLLPT